jgi:molecular chaperone GrpE
MSDRNRPDSGGAPTPEAPHASASGPGTPPEEATVNERPVSGAQPEGSAQAQEAEPEDHEAKLERDLNELAAKAEKADEYLELAQRTQADFENYRKRAARETAAAQARGVVKLAKELLPAVDSLDRALAAAGGSANGDDHDLASGIKLVHAEVLAALARVGVEPFSPEGERFDPEHHEAVAQLPVDGAEAGTVVEVYQRGYRLGDSVIRPAKVVVAG